MVLLLISIPYSLLRKQKQFWVVTKKQAHQIIPDCFRVTMLLIVVGKKHNDAHTAQVPQCAITSARIPLQFLGYFSIQFRENIIFLYVMIY